MSKIDTYVRESVTDTKEMKRLLKIIVKTEMFKGEDIPEPSNKRLFPRTSTIRNHTTHTKRKLCPMIFRRKSSNGSYQINPVTYFLDQKHSFHYDEIVEESPEDDSNIEKHDGIRLGKTETTPFLLFIKMGGKRDCLPDMVTR